jgi:hypothetical protein
VSKSECKKKKKMSAAEDADDLFGDDDAEVSPVPDVDADMNKDLTKRSRIIDDDENDDEKQNVTANNENRNDNDDLFGDDEDNGISDNTVGGFIVKSNLPVEKPKITSKLSLLPVDLLPNDTDNMYHLYSHFLNHLIHLTYSL